MPPTPRYQLQTEGVWRPEPGAGFVIGGALLAAAIVIAVIALREAVAAAGASQILWLLGGAVAIGAATGIAMLLLRLRSIRYILGPDRLIVQRRGFVIAIPYHAIDTVILRPRDRIEIPGFERFWPGYYDGLVATSEGPWFTLATTPAHRRVRIQSGHHPVLAISPERPVLFVEALETRRRASGARPSLVEDAVPAGVEMPAMATPRPVSAPSPDPKPVPQRSPVARAERARPELPSWVGAPEAWRVFRQRIVRGDELASNLLALNLIALIVLVTLTVWRADAVNSPVAVRWDAAGEPVERVRAEGFWVFEGVWLFPVTAAAIVVINAALSTLAAYADRLREARMLLAASLPVELVLMAALWRSTS